MTDFAAVIAQSRHDQCRVRGGTHEEHHVRAPEIVRLCSGVSQHTAGPVRAVRHDDTVKQLTNGLGAEAIIQGSDSVLNQRLHARRGLRPPRSSELSRARSSW